MDYVIKVSEGRLQEARERQCLTDPFQDFPGPAAEKPHVVLLRFKDEGAITPSAYCMVAVRASQAGVEGLHLRERCGIWGVTDGDFTKWIESQGGELYRNDSKGAELLDDEGLVASTWACKMGDSYGEGRYAFEAIAAALDDRHVALLPAPKWITAPDERIQAACR